MIEARAIIELFGKPANAIELALKEIVKKIGERENIEIQNTEYGKPEQKQQGYYTAFVEVTIKTKKFDDLIGFLIDFGPTNIEILEPEQIKITNDELETSLNDLLGKIHEFDKKLKTITTHYLQLEQKLNQLKK